MVLALIIAYMVLPIVVGDGSLPSVTLLAYM